MGRFKQLASETTQLSDLYNGRKKLETSNVIGKELTISDFDLVNMSSDDKVTQFCAVTFDELEGFVYNGGLVLTKMIVAWCEEFDSVDAAREAYKADPDKVKIRLNETKTKDDKRNLVTVDLL